MSVLVTGANGFVGAATVDRLLARGAEVRCLVRAGSDRRRLDAVLRRHARGELVVGSLASPRAAAEIVAGAETIVHLAARLRGAPADIFRDTVVASKNLIEAALDREKPPRIVLVSSFSVYGVAALARGSVVDETTAIEPEPLRRDVYAQAKIRQEKLFFDYRRERPYPLVVVRPGVVYGPGGSVLTTRVGLSLPGLFLFLGGDSLLPLSYVDNCAEAIACAAERGEPGEAYNVVDDDLPTARQFLARYEREVGKLRRVGVSYPVLWLGSQLIERYHRWSRGQLPAILTPYKIASMHKGMRYHNAKLKALDWQPIVSTDEALGRTFASVEGKAA
jgi:nucleoside-diphosphate-sugar epimerase